MRVDAEGNARVLQDQLRDRRRRSAYDDDDDDGDDDFDSRPSSQRPGKGKTKKSKRTTVWQRAKLLLQPTSDWGPASRNLSTPSRTLTHTPSPGNQELDHALGRTDLNATSPLERLSLR